MYLKQSDAWKQAQIVGESEIRDISETHYQEKDYLGRYLPNPMISLKELRGNREFNTPVPN